MLPPYATPYEMTNKLGDSLLTKAVREAEDQIERLLVKAKAAGATDQELRHLMATATQESRSSAEFNVAQCLEKLVNAFINRGIE